MEPENRPYVDSDTEPGDAGTEEWADTPPEPNKRGQGPLAQPPGLADADGIVDGSPADEFVNDPGAIDKRGNDDEDDGA